MKYIAVLLISFMFLYSKNYSQNDLKIRLGNDITINNTKAKIVKFGGDKTPECKLAISKDGNYFFLTKINSTCKKDINSAGIKIICNSNKSVCKTREELVDFIQKHQTKSNNNEENKNSKPSWCKWAKAYVEKRICLNKNLSKLDIKLTNLFKKALKNTSNPQKLKKSESKWVINRNKNCDFKSDKCIEKAYNNRINYLNSILNQNITEKNNNSDSSSLENKDLYHDDLYKNLIFSSCKDNDKDYCFVIAALYDDGKNGFPLDKEKALKYYKKSCNLKSKTGCYNAGIMYINGEGTSIDLDEALYYLQKACNLGKSKACSEADKIKEYKENKFRGALKNKCYRIKEYGPRNVCLNGIKTDACYSLKDYGLRKVCLNGANSDNCYSLKDYNLRNVCLNGVKSDACYSISDYDMRNSCLNFSGSTEFWLILAYYGYYTN